MKSIAMPRPVQVDDEIRKQLMHEVKETLATDIVFKNKKRFTTADLWHLQKSRRTASYLMSR